MFRYKVGLVQFRASSELAARGPLENALPIILSTNYSIICIKNRALLLRCWNARENIFISLDICFHGLLYYLNNGHYAIDPFASMSFPQQNEQAFVPDAPLDKRKAMDGNLTHWWPALIQRFQWLWLLVCGNLSALFTFASFGTFVTIQLIHYPCTFHAASRSIISIGPLSL
jgi:hypothetical protein